MTFTHGLSTFQGPNRGFSNDRQAPARKYVHELERRLIYYGPLRPHLVTVCHSLAAKKLSAAKHTRMPAARQAKPQQKPSQR
ncbi:hypothetical protein BN2476_130016 [Paraburkholderia piptadeniae]|uniref:Uncharacterized protein n=1 Tax=Paraburkholderia piptadeniae TaxID=1701573 RepID=A0A1N7RR63_9BURK|nr:hypothetical protein BN2476_130016 [Paraburkholderia piptadeniae]